MLKVEELHFILCYFRINAFRCLCNALVSVSSSQFDAYLGIYVQHAHEYNFASRKQLFEIPESSYYLLNTAFNK